ncbi:unnamed protein product [Closterium sp. NIES-65]|nr:unnamed protein product [Closterium sp. NIES-65]
MMEPRTNINSLSDDLLFAILRQSFEQSTSTSPFTKLEELLITECSELETLPDDVRDLVPCLRKLTMQDCYSFSHLPETFTSLSRLEELIVSISNEFALPDSFGHMPALKLLVLDAMEILDLPPSFSHLTSLEALFFNKCYELSVPAGSFSLMALKALCFSDSQHLALPEDVGVLATLKALRLHDCQRIPLPTSFTQLSSLTSLELNACDGVQLPDALGELIGIQELKIIKIPTSTLPSSLTRLTRLQTLEVRLCKLLSEVPSRLDTLVRLKRLELTECRQLNGPPTALPPSLETLNLGPFRKGSFHVVDISMPSLLRVLKLNCVNVECGPAVSWRLSCEEQLEQLGLYSEGEGRELPLPSTFLPHLRNLMSEQLEMLKRLEKLEQQKHMAQLEQLEQLEMHLEGSNPKLPIPLTFLPRLRSLLIKAPAVRSLPGNMGTVLPQLRQVELLSWSPEELRESIWGLSSLTSLKLHAPQLVALP